MEGRDEKVKVKMFVYVTGSKGREIYETLHFDKARDERTLQDVMNAFEEHWNLTKNETVQRYKFFTWIQEEGESIEKFVTDLKLLAATCNFGTLHDSPIRIRIICGKSCLKWLTLILKNVYVCVVWANSEKSKIKLLKLLNR